MALADSKLSIDDILDEYSGSGGKSDAAAGTNTAKIDIDDIINEVKAPLADNTEQAETAPATQTPARDDKDENRDFADKYGRLGEKISAIKQQNKAETYFKPEPKPSRSFSEKLESDTYIDDEREETEEKRDKSVRREKIRQTLSEDLFSKAGLMPTVDEKDTEVPPIAAAEQAAAPKKENPFEKYSAIEESSERSVDDILAEYENHENERARHIKGENTVHRSFTDLFTRLIPRSEAEEGSQPSNTELLDGMMKLKKERRSRTSQIPPVERKTISDIDLNLDSKIIHDTAPLPDTSRVSQSEAEKLNELKQRRSEKIKDFVFVGEDEDESDDNDNEARTLDDFESFDDAPSVAADIAQLRGSLMLRLLVLIVCFAASFYITVANDTGFLPVPDILNMRTQTNVYLFVNAIIGIFAAFASYTVISCGLSKILTLKADGDSICALSSVASIITSMVLFANTNLVKGGIVHIYVAASIAALIFNTVGKLLIVLRTQRSFRFISGGSEKYALFQIENEDKAQSFTRGALHDFPVLSAMRKTEFFTDFLKTTYSPDSTDSFSRLFTPIIIAASAVVAVLAGITSHNEYGSSGVYVGISAFVGCMALCSTFSMMLVVNLPMARSSKKNAELQGVLLGYDCVDKFADTNSVLIDATELFPQGSVNLSAIKVFSDMRIDEAIVEAASLTNQSGSILKNMFYDIIAGKTEMLNPVESYIFEDSMGICGWINNKRVLLGNRELMINHSIEGTPTEAKEREYTANGKAAVYLSISGELSAMFIVDISPSMEVKQALGELQRSNIYTIIRSVDSLVTLNRLSELFDVSPEYFRLVPFRMHKDFDEVTGYQPKQSALLACSGRFAAFSSLILSCRSIRGTVTAGIGIQAVSILLGILICLAMVILRSFGEITSAMIITYNLIFTAILVLFQMFRRN